MTRSIRDGFASTAYEPVAQTFFGLRAFKIQTTGYAPAGPAGAGVISEGGPRGGLRGVFKSAFQWGAGTNHAVCLRTARPSPVDMVDGKPHALMMPECDCGFWAYTADTHILSLTGPAVLGVVEGWGRCVLGPHGFRAERARIVALAFPTRAEADQGMIDSAGAHLADSLRVASSTLTRVVHADGCRHVGQARFERAGPAGDRTSEAPLGAAGRRSGGRRPALLPRRGGVRQRVPAAPGVPALGPGRAAARRGAAH